MPSPTKTLVACAALLMALPAAGATTEFRSISDTSAILYDAPSVKSVKRFVMSRGYPVEVIVSLEGWTKVRDASGELTWVESKSLSAQRTVMVKAPVADVRAAANDNAPLVFQAEQNVLLDLVELTGSGWAKVTHRDGQSGYIKLNQIWGA